MRIHNLRCNFLTDPLGIDDTSPALSWELAEAGASSRQGACRILVSSTRDFAQHEQPDLWDSGRVVGPATRIRYAGVPLRSRMRCFWQVIVWDESGTEHRSDVALWTMGLLTDGDWTGKWIGLDEDAQTPPEPFADARWIWRNKAPTPGTVCFSKRFTLDSSMAGMLWGLADDAAEVEIDGQPLCQLPRTQSNTDLYPMPVAISVPPLSAGEHHIRITAHKHHARDAHAGVIVRLAMGASEAVDFGKNQEVALTSGRKSKIQSLLDVVTDASWSIDGDASKVCELGSYGVEPWHRVTVQEYPNLPARYLRREFESRGELARATLYFSGLGLSEAWINGQRVGDEVLSPHATDANARYYYRTHDVTQLVRKGDNALGCILGNGRFFAPRRRVPFPMENYGCPKLLLQLELEFADGSSKRLVSNSSWRLTTQGAVGWNNEFDGEHYDARLDDPAWSCVGFDDSRWSKPALVAAPLGRRAAQRSAPIRTHEAIAPVAQWTTKYGTTIFDFCENVTGWCRLVLRGEAGAHLTLRHAEGMESPDALAVENLRSAQATDHITLREGETRFEPKFVYHGFRYAELRGQAEVVSIEAVYVHDEVPQVGSFRCSNETVNRIVQAAARGIRSNCRSMPTDCPQRDERMGWLGDRAGGAPGEMFLFELKNFYEKWLEDIRDAQAVNGCIPDVAPPFWRMYQDDVTWPSVITLLPHWLYRHYGDAASVSESFPAIERWIEHISSYLEAGIIDRDIYGDWCVPPEESHLILTQQAERKTHPAILASTYLAKNLEVAAAFARQMGKNELAARWTARREEIAAALNARFFHPDSGSYDNGAQTAALLPLAFDLVPPESRSKVFEYLVGRITETGEPVLGTGLVGGQWLMRTLTRHGRGDIALALATREEYPSWGYMIRNGATTIWELWNGDTAAPFMNSGNHVMLLGDLLAWLFEDVAGIQPSAPGFSQITLRPHFLFDSVDCEHRSMHGLIRSQWHIDRDAVEWNVTIPANVAACAELPASAADTIRVDDNVPELEHLGQAGDAHGRVRLQLTPGRHCLRFAKSE